MEQLLFKEISALDTEEINTEFENIDILSTEEILTLINEQDKLVPLAITSQIPYIAQAVEAVVSAFRAGGRLIYVGAGTSGRLGILDAAECPPTFGSNPDMVQGIIAGGREAAFRAIEGAEDLPEEGEKQIEILNISSNDVVCGLAASGRTPFVVAALKKAKELKAVTILISTNSREKIIEKGVNVDIMICPKVGAEVIAGSTRMKSGTAQKLILNMITTTAMIKIGKTYKNIMIDLKPTNNKLKERAKRILMIVTDASFDDAEKVLNETNYNVKISIIMLLCKIGMTEAEELLNKTNGKIREAMNYKGSSNN